MAGSRFEWLKPLFTEHKGVKMLSLLLAALTWYSVRGVIGVEVDIHGIPIQIEVKDGLAILSQSDAKAVVTFKGSQEDLAVLDEAHRKGDVKAVLYAKTDNVEDPLTLTVRPQSIEGTRGVRAIKIKTPDTVTIELDEETERELLVSVERSGTPAVGYVASVTCKPTSVRITGPKKRLMTKSLLSLRTEAVDVSQSSESFTRSVRVLSPSDQWVSGIEPSKVVVSVTIERRFGTTEWKDVPVLALTEPSKGLTAEVRPRTVTVRLTGRQELLDSLSAESFSVFIDCQGLDVAATYDLPLTFHIGGDKEINAEIEPAEAQVVLKEEQL